MTKLLVASIGLAISVPANAGPLYRTSLVPPSSPSPGRPPRTPEQGKGYIFLAPYFIAVSNRISVAVLPPAKSDSGGASAPTVTIALAAKPETRGYLYLRRNAWYATAANVSTSTSGLLSGSDTSSTQQVSAILTEVAQTVSPFHLFDVAINPSTPPPPPKTPRQKCAAALKELIGDGPLYRDLGPVAPTSAFTTIAELTIKEQRVGEIRLAIADAITPDASSSLPIASGQSIDGIVAFFPAPAKVTVQCKLDGVDPAVDLSAPATLNFYVNPQVLNPQREFLTSPQDTYTFSDGFITGHKFSNQSAAKTFVDTITAPVRALLPSVSVQQSVQVQTGGGKPDQTTTTTQTTTAPPK